MDFGFDFDHLSKQEREEINSFKQEILQKDISTEAKTIFTEFLELFENICNFPEEEFDQILEEWCIYVKSQVTHEIWKEIEINLNELSNDKEMETSETSGEIPETSEESGEDLKAQIQSLSNDAQKVMANFLELTQAIHELPQEEQLEIIEEWNQQTKSEVSKETWEEVTHYLYDTAIGTGKEIELPIKDIHPGLNLVIKGPKDELKYKWEIDSDQPYDLPQIREQIKENFGDSFLPGWRCDVCLEEFEPNRKVLQHRCPECLDIDVCETCYRQNLRPDDCQHNLDNYKVL